MALVPYFEFVRIPLVFYNSIGQELYEQPDSLRSRLKVSFFILAMLNYNVLWLGQITLFFIALNMASMELVATVTPCTVFGFLGNAKQMTLTLNKRAIRGIMNELEVIYPNDPQSQKKFNVAGCVRTLKPIMKLFAGLCVFNSVYFALYPLFKSAYKSLFEGEAFDFPLGFPVWYPYDYTANWLVYIVTFSLQFYAGLLTGVGFLTADLLFVSAVSQLCMHFDYIARRLRDYMPVSREADHKFLRDVIRHHAKCLDLSDSVDKVFGFSLFLNFMSSAGTLCFVGFQVTSASAEEVLRFCILLVISLTQVLIICIYGNSLIDTSLSVADAAFDHPWYKCDLAYKKMLTLIIRRSQKAAAIHAPTFPPISLQTFMKVISMAYQFFAVLQTMDSK